MQSAANDDKESCDLCKVTFTGRYRKKSLRQHVQYTIQHSLNVARAAAAAAAAASTATAKTPAPRGNEEYQYDRPQSPGGFADGRDIEKDDSDHGDDHDDDDMVIVDGDNTFDARSGPDLSDIDEEDKEDDEDDSEEDEDDGDGNPSGTGPSVPFDFQFLSAFQAWVAAGSRGPRPEAANLPQIDPAAPKPGPWEPFDSELDFLSYLLVQSIGLSQKKLGTLWSILALMGLKLPPLSRILSMRRKLRSFSVEEFTTKRGFKFSAIPIMEHLRADLSSPTMAMALHTPHPQNPNHIQDDWDGSKWHTEYPRPMLPTHRGLFFIGDVVTSDADGVIGQLAGFKYLHSTNGQTKMAASIMIPRKSADDHDPQETQWREVFVHPDELAALSADRMGDLNASQRKVFDRRKDTGALARHLPHMVIPVKVWVDDMSGVRSKRFSPFLNVRLINCVHPVARQYDQDNLKFICSAACYDTIDMITPLVDRIRELEEGFVAFDGVTNQMVFVQLFVLGWMGDNPMLEKLSMLTGKSVCRLCSFSTATHLRGQSRDSTQTISTFFLAGENRSEFGLTNQFSPVYNLLTLDPSVDFLLDYVHNVSLGWVKRLTILTFELAGKVDKAHIIKLINSFDFVAAGLTFTQSGSRVVNYHRSFDGHDFKQLVQYFAFVAADWVQAMRPEEGKALDLVRCWARAGKVAAMLWKRRYERNWLPILQQELDQLAMSLFELDERLTQVRKIHLSTHVPDQAERHGTQRGAAVEGMEASNKVTRSIKLDRSNQRKPSRDIAVHFADRASLLHLLELPRMTPQGKWYKIGDSLRSYIAANRDDIKKLILPSSQPTSGSTHAGQGRYTVSSNASGKTFRAVVSASGRKVHVGQGFLSGDQVFVLKHVRQPRDGNNIVTVEATSLQYVHAHPHLQCPVLQAHGQLIMTSVHIHKPIGIVKMGHTDMFFLNIFAHEHAND